MPSETKHLWFWIFSAYIIQGAAYILATVLFCIFLQIRIHGKENLDTIKSGVVFASNHVHELDAVLLRTSFPLVSNFGPLFAVARPGKIYKWKGWRKIIYLETFFRLMGAHPAPKGLHNYEASLKTFVALGKRNKTIVIFIGGRQHSIDEPIENRGGASYISWATGLPIVPVAIKGTFDLSVKKFIFERPVLDIFFGIPLSPDVLFADQDQGNLDFKKASKIVTTEIEKMLQ